MSWIAEYDTQGREFPTCVHVTKTTGTMTHGATYVPIEDGKAVRVENAKLRELARHMHTCMEHHEMDGTISCDRCPLNNCVGNCDYERRMRELGVEVTS